MTSWKLPGSKRNYGAYQVSGTFGGATVKLQASNDDATFFDMKDDNNTAISGTAAGYFEFTTNAGYVKPASSGGTADNVDVVITFRYN